MARAAKKLVDALADVNEAVRGGVDVVTALKNAAGSADDVSANADRGRAAEKPTPDLIPESTMLRVPLCCLVRADENVRHRDSADGVDELAEDIAGHGLLQSLIGYWAGTYVEGWGERVAIVGGGRRLQALQLLREQGRIASDYRVNVLIRDKADAIELSLAENLARRNMNPVDEFTAFAALMTNGRATPADLAKRFGYTERYVKQRMRLADLHPDVLAAVATRAITLDAAMAYAATADAELQLRVFTGQTKSSWNAHAPDSIRREIAAKGLRADDVLVRYAGIDAYIAAGGTFEDDLFATADGDDGDGADARRLSDIGLVERIAFGRAFDELPPLAAKSDVAELLLTPTIRKIGWSIERPKTPKGMAWIGTQYGGAAKWTTARTAGIAITAVAFVDSTATLVMSDDGFFVDKAAVTTIEPPQPEREPFREQTPEERAAMLRARDVQNWSARLSTVPQALQGVASGRLSWGTNWNAVSAGRHPDFGDGWRVTAEIFVTDAEAAAMEMAAEAHVDALEVSRLAVIEAQRAAKADAVAVRAALEETLRANPPAVIEAGNVVYYRWADGSYIDVPEGEDEAEAEWSAANLEELIESGEEIDGHWPTVEAFHADEAV